MSRFDTIEDPRRRQLIRALTAGLLSVGWPLQSAFGQSVFGSRPAKLPPGQSIYRLTGTATVNGAAANLQTVVRPGDTVQTGKDSEMVFAVGGQAMILRAESRLSLEGGGSAAAALLLSALRLVTGKLLSVSRSAQFRVHTPTATIGIRGTGFYAEADPEQTYFCTCYGVTEIAANNDPESRDAVSAKHHDKPLYIAAKAPAGRAIRAAPFINHTDQELMLIETLVGRTTPFVFPKDSYGGPRREY
ncbi:MAG: hypothetical protein A3H34_06990 [Betaproteobacteria bacterium RIFCSPLOWO2_02_FULL_67_19]|nr:MAG: hypothetical protein A3H34_06990 [Betaproteobacteria bacterium RIFCSPLOWO2_02_FULL_67_19]